MSTRETYPPGVPCWVDTLQPDVAGALEFYGGLFGWQSAGPGPLPDGSEYHVLTHADQVVAAIGSLPERDAPPVAWTTYVRVEDVGAAAGRASAAGGRVLVDPVDVGPPGRLAVIEDPVGAVFAVWQAGAREGAALVNEPGAWAMSTLLTTEPERAQAFYGELFGWQFDTSFGEGIWLCRLPGYVGGEERQPVPRDVVAVIVEVETPGGPAWNVDFWIADADRAAQDAARLGGSVLEAPHEDVPMFRRTVIADPAGAAFSVSQLLVEL